VKLVDLNVLLYAVNRDAPNHATVHRWWEAALGGEEPVGLSWLVLLGFLRLATNPKVFPKPLSVDDALGRVDAWLAHPNAKLVSETDHHWPVLRSLIAATGGSGNLTSDAHLAALAMEYGAVLVSCDTDFARFPGLRWERPV